VIAVVTSSSIIYRNLQAETIALEDTSLSIKVASWSVCADHPRSLHSLSSLLCTVAMAPFSKGKSFTGIDPDPGV
jgi:hypothetical protein